MKAHYFFLAVCLLVSACAVPVQRELSPDIATQETVLAAHTIVFGIIGHPERRPWVVDSITNVIPLSSDGELPKMGALVTSTTRKSFVLSYVVYRRNTATGKYELNERSPHWIIRENDAHPPSALIKPDFVDGILVGDYQFEIFIDQQLAKTVLFSVVRGVT